MAATPSARRILVGEGSAEPVRGLRFARELFGTAPTEFVFGVRRTDEGLAAIDQPGVSLLAAFPGRGLTRFGQPTRCCSLSASGIQRVLATRRLRADALVVVAAPAGSDGSRSLGTVNGCMQAAVDAAPLVVIEEDPSLPLLAGAARIPADKPVWILQHEAAAYRALSRLADSVDQACAEHIAGLLADDITLQLGVGGPIEALGSSLRRRRRLRIVTGAIGSSLRELHANGCLAIDAPILGTALVGDDELVAWARRTPQLTLGPSSQVHNPKWLAAQPRFHSINVAISVDLAGNVNAEWAGRRRVSGPGGAPDFARGARLSRGGAAIVALRADRGGALVESIARPTIPAANVGFVVCERGVADLRGKDIRERSAALTRLLG